MNENIDNPYHDALAEVVFMAKQLPVGTYWCDEFSVYNIKSIELSDSAVVRCEQVSLNIAQALYEGGKNPIYSYSRSNSLLRIDNIHQLEKVSEAEYMRQSAMVDAAQEHKSNELFQKQCLFKMPTEDPFTDFDTLNDEIMHLRGKQYFYYEPMDNCFRLLCLDMDTYQGKDTYPTEWHFVLSKHKEQVSVYACQGVQSSKLSELIRNMSFFPITEFQFMELSKLIELNPHDER